MLGGLTDNYLRLFAIFVCVAKKDKENTILWNLSSSTGVLPQQ